MPMFYLTDIFAQEAHRAAVVACLDSIHKASGLAAMVDAELVSPSLASGKPNEQSDLLTWMTAKCNGVPVKEVA